MSPKVDLATWIERHEVARRLGIKPRTVNKLVQNGELHPELVPVAGVSGSGTNFYDPAEVDSVRRKREVGARVLTQYLEAKPRLPAPRPASGGQLERLPPIIDVPPAKPAKRSPALEQLLRPMLPIDRKRYLTVAEAIEYTGLGARTLERKLGRGECIGPHGARVYPRVKLDKV